MTMTSKAPWGTDCVEHVRAVKPPPYAVVVRSQVVLLVVVLGTCLIKSRAYISALDFYFVNSTPDKATDKYRLCKKTDHAKL